MCYNTRFSHIYVERCIRNHPRTEQILLRFPQAQIVEIEHYKDVFNRHGQDCVRQHQAQALILAEKTDHFFYEGAPVCQDFGNTNFYYCSTMMNCIYDCSYCYLKGMYPSGHMVLFVNIEDYLEELDHILKTQNMYVCISYDADLLAMEAVTGYVRLWSAYAAKHENLKLEIRTKCAGHAMWDLPCLSNVIYAFTLSPQKMIDAFEKETPSAFARIVCAAEGLKKGFPVRLCFDPMLYLPSWKTDYLQLLSQIDRIFGDRMLHDGWEKLVDVSVGTFRISQEYMKKLRRVEPFAPAVQYPYVNCNGVYQYPPELLKKMEYIMSKAAIVTGASSGIGLAISRVLCEKGYEVYGFGRDFAKEQTREFVEQTAAFHPVEGDLLEEQKLCDAVKEITKTADIEVLVNAAGVGHYGLHEELTPKKIQALVRTNLEIPLLLTNRLLRVLKKNHGYIINISSVTAKQSSPHGCAYAATKAGLSSFGKSLFEEARKYGVKVTTIHPDMTDTNLYRDADFTCGEEPESYLLPDEVAKAVAYVLDQREGMVVPEITLRPQLHRIARK